MPILREPEEFKEVINSTNLPNSLRNVALKLYQETGYILKYKDRLVFLTSCLGIVNEIAKGHRMDLGTIGVYIQEVEDQLQDFSAIPDFKATPIFDITKEFLAVVGSVVGCTLGNLLYLAAFPLDLACRKDANNGFIGKTTNLINSCCGVLSKYIPDLIQDPNAFSTENRQPTERQQSKYATALRAFRAQVAEDVPTDTSDDDEIKGQGLN